MNLYKLMFAFRTNRQAAKANAAKAEQKREWNRQSTYQELLNKYQACKGQVIHNATREEQLFPIITRQEALAQVQEIQQQQQDPTQARQTFQLGIWNFMLMQNRLFMMGVTPHHATVALEITDLRPRFWMSLPYVRCANPLLTINSYHHSFIEKRWPPCRLQKCKNS
jgi:hypothetical protein